uniref:chitinase n=1 Tax=uncultured bacterium contig00152 TaxID=1181591 RepID=A0A806KP80_9BACT|nr:chitinase [uncultured bacterium contig00152]
MKRILLIFLLFASSIFAAGPKVAGYFPHWAGYSSFKPADVRYVFLTDIRYCCLEPSGSDLLFADENDKANFTELVRLAKENNVRVFVSIGGIGYEETIASLSASNLEQAARKFVSEHGIDGFEIDGGEIDFDGARNIASLADALANAGFSVSLAIPGNASLSEAISAVAGRIDAISLWFTDQMNANESAVKPNSNTTENIRVLAAFANAGIPREKLIAILPLYGKSFEGVSSLGSSFTGIGSGNEGVLKYKELMDKFNRADVYNVSFDNASQSEIALSESEIIVFNGIPSMQAMARAVKESGYGGIAVFDLTGDHKEPIVSLLVTINQILRPEVDFKKKR